MVKWGGDMIMLLKACGVEWSGGRMCRKTNTVAKGFSTMAKKKMLIFNNLCNTFYSLAKDVRQHWSSAAELKVKAVQCWLESEIEEFVQDSCLLEMTKLSNLCSWGIHNPPFIKRHYVFVKKKVIYSFNIFWTQCSKAREDCCVYYWLGWQAVC